MDKPSFAFADYALERWARKAAGDLTALGWPPVTLLGRIIEFGISGAAQPGAKVLEIDELFQATDMAISRLSEQEKLVVCTHYAGTWKTEKVSAYKIGLSHDTFRKALQFARSKVQSYLEGRFHTSVNTKY